MNAVSCIKLSVFICLVSFIYVALQFQTYLSYGTAAKRNNEKKINLPVIFVVGHPGSGTTLMKTILEVSPKIHCGYETKIIPMILETLKEFNLIKSEVNKKIKSEVIEEAMRSFIYEILTKKDEDNATKIFCAKDPNTIEHILMLSKLFSKAKFVYMVRDGRGSALSIMKRENRTMNDTNLFHTLVKVWNRVNRRAYKDCVKIGRDRCMVVKYEDLVEYEEKTIQQTTKFLKIEYNKSFLSHENHLKKEFLEEKSAGKQYQSFSKTYKSSLDTWTGRINYSKNYLKSRCEMFRRFGYELQ